MDNCCGGMCARIHSCPSPSLCSPQVFILIEHPVEREKLAVAQELLKEQRANFLNLGRTDGRGRSSSRFQTPLEGGPYMNCSDKISEGKEISLSVLK